MKFTAFDIQNAYDYLKSTYPFNTWNLPDSETVQFKVIRSRMQMGNYDVDPHAIRASTNTISTFGELLETVAHEMVHFHCEKEDHENHPEHDEYFKSYALLVCEAWGFDPESF